MEDLDFRNHAFVQFNIWRNATQGKRKKKVSFLGAAVEQVRE